MSNNAYQPVPHDAEFRAKLLLKAGVQAAYDASALEYAVLDEMLTARKESGLTQAQVAERMGTKASAVARLENSMASAKHSPSIETLQKYAKALGKQLEIHLV